MVRKSTHLLFIISLFICSVGYVDTVYSNDLNLSDETSHEIAAHSIVTAQKVFQELAYLQKSAPEQMGTVLVLYEPVIVQLIDILDKTELNTFGEFKLQYNAKYCKQELEKLVAAIRTIKENLSEEEREELEHMQKESSIFQQYPGLYEPSGPSNILPVLIDKLPLTLGIIAAIFFSWKIFKAVSDDSKEDLKNEIAKLQRLVQEYDANLEKSDKTFLEAIEVGKTEITAHALLIKEKTGDLDTMAKSITDAREILGRIYKAAGLVKNAVPTRVGKLFGRKRAGSKSSNRPNIIKKSDSKDQLEVHRKLSMGSSGSINVDPEKIDADAEKKLNAEDDDQSKKRYSGNRESTTLSKEQQKKLNEQLQRQDSAKLQELLGDIDEEKKSLIEMLIDQKPQHSTLTRLRSETIEVGALGGKGSKKGGFSSLRQITFKRKKSSRSGPNRRTELDKERQEKLKELYRKSSLPGTLKISNPDIPETNVTFGKPTTFGGPSNVPPGPPPKPPIREGEIKAGQGLKGMNLISRKEAMAKFGSKDKEE